MALAYVFNASGSDTQASGTAPATAIFGTAASFTGSVVTLDGSPDLSAFDATTWGLWLNTTTGRQWFELSAADNGAKTVTTTDAPAGTTSGLTWAIGGKRASIGATTSRNLFGSTGAKIGSIITLETDQSISTALAIAAPHITIKGDTTGRLITQTGNAAILAPAATLRLNNLKFTHSNATKTNAFPLDFTANASVWADNCIFGDGTNKINGVYRRSGGATVVGLLNCEVRDCTGIAFPFNGTTHTGLYLRHCWCHTGASDCISISSGGITASQILIKDTIIEGFTGDGIVGSTGNVAGVLIANNTINGNADGIDLSAAAPIGRDWSIVNNLITNNTVGLRGRSDIVQYLAEQRQNNVWNNTTNRTNWTADSTDYSIDPSYTNAGSNDFSVGVAMKGLAYPVGGTDKIGAGQSNTNSYREPGASQRQEITGLAQSSLIVRQTNSL